MSRMFTVYCVVGGLALAGAGFAEEEPRAPLDICLETIANAGTESGQAKFWSALKANVWTDATRRGVVEWFATQTRRHGAPVKSRFLARWGAGRGGVFEIRLGDDQTIRGAVVIGDTQPSAIRWIHMAEPLPRADTAGGVLRAAGITPASCRVNLCGMNIDRGDTQVVCRINADSRAYVASLHKLIVLRALSRSVRSGESQWDSVLRKRRDLVSGGSGLLQDWPVGSPITVQTLATMMISESDNMATDHLIDRLSRQAVEDAMRRADPTAEPDSRNSPYLLTAEAFQLRAAHGDQGTKLAGRFVAGTARQRLRLLKLIENVTGQPATARPIARRFRDKIGWFASPKEVCRTAIAIAEACDWSTSDTEMGILASGVAKVRLLPVSRSYLAVKAGMDEGHRSRFALIQSKLGTWHALCLILNGEESSLRAVRLNDAFEHLSYLMIAGALRQK